MSKCKYCKEDIIWKYPYGQVPEGVKNEPYNHDGTLHNETCEVILKAKPIDQLVTDAIASNGGPTHIAGVRVLPKKPDATNDDILLALKALDKRLESLVKQIIELI